MSKEQWLRYRCGEDHADVVQSRISKAARMPTMPKGAGWRTSMVPRVSVMVPRVSVMSMVSRMSVMLEGIPDEMAGRDRQEKSDCASRMPATPKRRGAEDADGIAGADDFPLPP